MFKTALVIVLLVSLFVMPVMADVTTGTPTTVTKTVNLTTQQKALVAAATAALIFVITLRDFLIPKTAGKIVAAPVKVLSKIYKKK